MEKMGARMEEVCRFAGSTMPALARRLKSRRPLQVVRSSFTAFNVTDGSGERRLLEWRA
jgi:DeoR/GlpR family transcriptional regulator of sugar metabolism